jgi:hypothetical protein
LKVE